MRWRTSKLACTLLSGIKVAFCALNYGLWVSAITNGGFDCIGKFGTV